MHNFPLPELKAKSYQIDIQTPIYSKEAVLNTYYKFTNIAVIYQKKRKITQPYVCR